MLLCGRARLIKSRPGESIVELEAEKCECATQSERPAASESECDGSKGVADNGSPPEVVQRPHTFSEGKLHGVICGPGLNLELVAGCF